MSTALTAQPAPQPAPPPGKAPLILVPRRRRRWIRLCVWLLVLSAAAAGLFVALRWGRSTVAGTLAVASAKKGEFLVITRCRGELRARRSAQITAPVNVPELRIVWQAPPSGPVKADEVVIRFDPSSANQQLQEKVAALKQAQATLDQAVAEAQITAEQDQRDLSAARYHVERARLEASKQDIVSALQAEEAKIDLATAEKKLRVQEATVTLHQASAKAKQASLARVREQAQTEVNITNRRIARMEIKSPLTGVIVYMPNYSQGWMNAKPFKVGDPVWPGAAIAEIPDLATLEMEGKIEEIDRGRIARGNRVRVRIDALPELSFDATLDQISPLTQMTWEFPPSSSFRGYAQIQKPDPRLRPGMNGTMDIVLNRLPNAISIPAKALFTHAGKPVVYVPVPNGYQSREVKVLARNPDEIAIEGVSHGTQVTLTEPEPKDRKQ